MSATVQSNNEIKNNVIEPFNKALLTDMVFKKQLDEAKEYVKQYLFKTYELLYYYDVGSNTITSFKHKNIKTFLSKNIFYKVRDNEDEKAIKKLFSDWFMDLDCTFYKLSYDLNEPFVYKKNSTHYLNLFRGFKFNNLTIQDETNEYIEEGMKYIFNHMNEVICSSDKPAYEYLKKWIAKLIYCKTKMKTCIYLKGTQGAGKSSLSNFLLEMVGEWNGHKTQSVKCLTGFNGELMGKCLLILEEMRTESYGEWLKINSTLNAFITEDLISLEDKGKTMIQVNNNLSIIITSNDSPIKMNEKDRRYFLSDVSNHRDGDKEYFNKLYEYMQNEAIQKAFYFECKRIMDETPKFNELSELKEITTSAKCEVIIKNLHPLYRYIRETYVLKNKDFNVFLKDLTSEFNISSAMRNDLNGIEVSRMLKDIHINGDVSTGNRLRYKIPHGDLLEIFKKLKWIHEMDEFEDDKHDKILNHGELQKLKDENEQLRKQLESYNRDDHYEFINEQIKKLKETISDLKENQQIINYHDEYIKTITPTVSPSNEKKKVVPFPRPSTVLNQNKLLTIDINNVIHKSIIDAF